jgi:hypothetical protein
MLHEGGGQFSGATLGGRVCLTAAVTATIGTYQGIQRGG